MLEKETLNIDVVGIKQTHSDLFSNQGSYPEHAAINYRSAQYINYIHMLIYYI